MILPLHDLMNSTLIKWIIWGAILAGILSLWHEVHENNRLSRERNRMLAQIEADTRRQLDLTERQHAEASMVRLSDALLKWAWFLAAVFFRLRLSH